MDIDFILIRKMKQGDDSAFDTFVRRYYSDILRYCSYHCADTDDAEDLTQETFTAFFTKLSDYRHQGKAKNYLYTIARNLCLNDYRRRKTFSVDDGQLAEIESSSDICRKKMEETLTDQMTLQWALDQLPHEFRQVIVLYYFQDRKMTEIAKELQIGLPLVKYRLRQAKKRLQKMLEGGGR